MSNPYKKPPKEGSDLESLVLPEISQEDMATVFGGIEPIEYPTCGC